MLFVLTGRGANGRLVCAIGVPGSMLEGLLSGKNVLALDGIDLLPFDGVGILRAESCEELLAKLPSLTGAQCREVDTDDPRSGGASN